MKELNELQEFLNKGHQRAGLLAIMAGVLQTSSCDATKKSIAGTLKHIFDEYSVGDDIERMTKRAMNEVLDQKDDQEDQMKVMFERLRDLLKD
jgi:hypothetical protein